jgi:hypothetical protein
MIKPKNPNIREHHCIYLKAEETTPHPSCHTTLNMATSRKKSQSKGKKRAASPGNTSKASKRAKTDSSTLASGTGTPKATGEPSQQTSRSRKATVVTEEEDNASHQGVTVIELPINISDDDGTRSQAESDDESSEAELGT